MYRLSFVATLVLAACGPSAEEPDAGFPLFSAPPVTSSAIPQGYGDSCSSDSNCHAGTACIAGPQGSSSSCISACNTDAECPTGTRCVGLPTKACYLTCASDGSCPSGLACYGDLTSRLNLCVRRANDPTGGGAGGGTGGGMGGGATGGGAAPSINMAEKVWVAQENVFRMSVQLRSSYGEDALSWLRFAKTLAGGQVTAGTLIEHADGTGSFTSGGSTLRITTKTGRQFQLRVDALVGDVSSSSFPWTDDRIDVTWIFSNGATARCVFARASERFVGTFVTDSNETITADVSRSTSSEVYSGDTGSGFATDIFGNGTFSGYVRFPDRRVDFTTDLVYSTCSGVCGFSAAQDYVYTHEVKLTFFDGGVWNLRYNTGWKKQYSYSITEFYWGGSIWGAGSGSMVKRTIAASAVALDVVIGADRYTATGVVVP